MPQHAAALGFEVLQVWVLKHAAACRSMPQHVDLDLDLDLDLNPLPIFQKVLLEW